MKKSLVIIFLMFTITTALVAVVVLDTSVDKIYDLEDIDNANSLVDELIIGSLSEIDLYVFEDGEDEGYNYSQYKDKKMDYFSNLIIDNNLDSITLREYVKENSQTIQEDLEALKLDVERLNYDFYKQFSLFAVDNAETHWCVISVFRDQSLQEVPIPEDTFYVGQLSKELQSVVYFPISESTSYIPVLFGPDTEITIVKKVDRPLIESDVWFEYIPEFKYNIEDVFDMDEEVVLLPEVVGDVCRYSVEYAPESLVEEYELPTMLIIADGELLMYETMGNTIEFEISKSTHIQMRLYDRIIFEGDVDESGNIS